jgi:putative transcriptional regulator
MTNAYNKIKAGLADVEAFLKNESTGHIIHEVAVAAPDVSAIRSKSGLSQRAFAQSIGVALGTLQGWEQGRRKPEGPARVLLALIDKRPGIVREELVGK